MECQELDQSASPEAYGTKKNSIMRRTENCVLKKVTRGQCLSKCVLWNIEDSRIIRRGEDTVEPL